MAILFNEQKLIVLLVPGTGSTSVEKGLLKLPSAQSLGGKHDTLPQLISNGEISAEDVKNHICVCFVRNHFDILHAEWHRSRTRWVFELDDRDSWLSRDEFKRLQIKQSCAKSFPDYISWQYEDQFNRREQLTIFKSYADHCQRIFFSEKVAEFGDWMSNQYRLTPLINKINVTVGRAPYWQSYDWKARTIVETVYRSEITHFNYHF